METMFFVRLNYIKIHEKLKHQYYDIARLVDSWKVCHNYEFYAVVKVHACVYTCNVLYQCRI